MSVSIPHSVIVDYVRAIFLASGCDGPEAGRVAENLSEANLMGHDSHGVIRTPRYVSWLADGKLFSGKTVTVESRTGAMAVLDGCFGLGQTVGPEAVDFGIDLARKQGVSVIALKHAGHLGRIGAWAERAARKDIVSLHFVNVAGSILVAPYGGTERRFSTAPVAIGIPRKGEGPLVLDFSTAEVAEGKVLVAAKGGKPLPDGCMIGPDGVLGNDPWLLYGDTDPALRPDCKDGPGAIRAFGGHKGSGLALICELLAGALTGSGCTGPGYDRVYNGMLSIYLPLENFNGAGFAEDVRAYVDYVRSARPVTGGEVLAPGEPEARLKAERLKNGIPLSDATWQALVTCGERLGVNAPQPT